MARRLGLPVILGKPFRDISLRRFGQARDRPAA